MGEDEITDPLENLSLIHLCENVCDDKWVKYARPFMNVDDTFLKERYNEKFLIEMRFDSNTYQYSLDGLINDRQLITGLGSDATLENIYVVLEVEYA